ncbi:MAG: HD domain-containing protein [Candidatus Woesearchaeota archaeon]|nr:HD domain-containing protein [Candidatus Woesearchaeota archaeon]
MLDKVKQFVNKAFKKKNVAHFERTIYWVKYLKPEADEAMLIAAYAHDIERAFRKENAEEKSFASGEILETHQKEGGKIIYDFLIKEGADEKFAKRVEELISKHENGGTEDQNIIKDADSISYFENNAERHVNWIKTKGFTKEEIKRKFDWMYGRISSKKAKKIVLPMYKKAIKLMGSY